MRYDMLWGLQTTLDGDMLSIHSIWNVQSLQLFYGH